MLLVLEIMILVQKFYIEALVLNMLVFLIKDFGVETLTSLIKGTNFPWILSNVTDNLTKLPLASSIEQLIIDFNGIKV
jgi:hypothetical protein